MTEKQIKANDIPRAITDDGLLIKIGSILFRSFVSANGRTGYKDPPTPTALRPVTDMRPLLRRPTMDVTTHEVIGH